MAARRRWSSISTSPDDQRPPPTAPPATSADASLELTESDLRIDSETHLAAEELADRRQRRRLRDLTNHTAAIALGIGLIGLFGVVFFGSASIHASAMQLIGVIIGAAAASLWSGRTGNDG